MTSHFSGTLITLMPAAGDLGHLLRAAIDAEQVGASRIHLPPDQDDIVALVPGLRENTELVITGDAGHPGTVLLDTLPSTAADVLLEAGPLGPDLVVEVGRIAAGSDGSDDIVSIGGRGDAAIPVLFAALAAGLHLLAGTAHTPLAAAPTDLRADPRGRGKDDAALIARASGLARIAGRPPLAGAAALEAWGVER